MIISLEWDLGSAVLLKFIINLVFAPKGLTTFDIKILISFVALTFLCINNWNSDP